MRAAFLTYLILSVSSALCLANSPDNEGCPPSTDLICHQDTTFSRRFYLYCIDTANKKAAFGAQSEAYALHQLYSPESSGKDPTFTGSLDNKLEVIGADYFSSTGRIILYTFNIKKIADNHNGTSIYESTVKSDGASQGEIFCHQHSSQETKSKN